ncbi:hypothetical protein TREMEDRAFT_62497 [Tremella mesenterica DSM 1558]|uniref:uncharacterized protein n=1 Tax=Tremella mesenterica (strain ATCC 24925 / CBS 8224 / DSM 1558 / NBRC 9311 / NRRL Y-6157 / RJB 2259-6 / UBC 559-6) TaxID=578456 RepID=UPI0003F4A413|nr:uncharacterized protein TREMEDRAFT_62497 [Tremella mesenterica DSM 1558]EIW69629.1 hypothetical protein TREMEDRAFT_62497 [Tremella mesenterica DSM 1558]
MSNTSVFIARSNDEPQAQGAPGNYDCSLSDIYTSVNPTLPEDNRHEYTESIFSNDGTMVDTSSIAESDNSDTYTLVTPTLPDGTEHEHKEDDNHEQTVSFRWGAYKLPTGMIELLTALADKTVEVINESNKGEDPNKAIFEPLTSYLEVASGMPASILDDARLFLMAKGEHHRDGSIGLAPKDALTANEKWSNWKYEPDFYLTIMYLHHARTFFLQQ